MEFLSNLKKAFTLPFMMAGMDTDVSYSDEDELDNIIRKSYKDVSSKEKQDGALLSIVFQKLTEKAKKFSLGQEKSIKLDHEDGNNKFKAELNDAETAKVSMAEEKAPSKESEEQSLEKFDELIK